MQHVYVFDIDGTLADITHRLHFIQDEKKDWDSFFAACIDDAPIGHMLDLAWYIGKDHYVIYVSGRSDAVRDLTRQWLEANMAPDGPLNMRQVASCESVACRRDSMPPSLRW